VSEWRVIQGDCLDVLRGMPDASVDAIVADPPYSSGGAFRSDRTAAPSSKYSPNTEAGRYGDFAGDNRDQRAYGYWCALWLAECLRIVKPGGSCSLFTDWRQLPTTTDALQAGGWVWRGIAVWDKTESARPAKGRYRNQCEYVVWGSRGPLGTEVGTTDDGVACLPGVWRKSMAGLEKDHVAQKPVEVLGGVVAICPKGGTILDPFCGSGTTGVACMQTGRNFIGIELDAGYCDIARRRIAEAANHLFAGGAK
jgi:site-specific DNA-methyltransferase (adenine-specific)